MSFSSKFCKIVDPKLISAKMKTFGHTYTTDSKDGSELEYKTLSEVSILKRRFIFDKTINAWFAPLELSSILEPLNWDKVDDRQEELKKFQYQVNAETAIRELAMHDEEIFGKYSKEIIQLCRENNLVLDPKCYLSQMSIRCYVKTSKDPSEITGPIVGPSDTDDNLNAIPSEAETCRIQQQKLNGDIFMSNAVATGLPKDSSPKVVQRSLTA